MKRIIIANWKMNPSSLKEAEKLFAGVSKSLPKLIKTEVAICAPYIYLEKLKKISKRVFLGGQDVFWEEAGAYTGEISALMLDNLGAKYVIVGHSERRGLGESNTDVNKKIKVALSASLTPILCVGEIERDESHGYFNVVKMQLEECLKGIPKNVLSKMIIAYEPVWALSTTVNRRDATANDSREMAVFIRKILSDRSGGEMKMPRILYGGSVNERDASEFIQNGGVDGLLVGRASLDAKKFTEIVRICEASSK